MDCKNQKNSKDSAKTKQIKVNNKIQRTINFLWFAKPKRLRGLTQTNQNEQNPLKL